MRIEPWSEALAPRSRELVDAVLARRGGKLLALDRALLWSEPLARGWNAHLGAVRREFSLPGRVREIAICTVARLTGAVYEFDHHWPVYVREGGDDALRPRLDDLSRASSDAAFSGEERVAMRYAIAMTRDVQVPEALFAEALACFGREQVVELTATVATYNMVARFLVALQITDEDAPAPGIARTA
jgi:alkylhydroperoxidase family enzyme